MKVALLLMACAGCDQVLGLETLGPEEPTLHYDKCAPSASEDPLRYAMIPQTFAASASWEDARASCLVRGMDLAVINQPSELGFASEAGAGYWFGASRGADESWMGVDGCPVPPMLPSPDQARCGTIMGASEISGASCDGTLPPDPITGDPRVIQGAFCETPRPETAACLPARSRDELYEVSPGPLTFQAARAFCKDLGLHLVVMSTSDEMPLLELVRQPAWIGATFDGKTWKSETGCPGLYSWTDLGPVLDADHTCATTAFAPDPETGDQRMIGVQTARCTETHYAICESD